MSRGLRTVSVASLLCCCYWAYAHTVTPLTRVDRSKLPAVPEMRIPAQPPAFREVADDMPAGADWTAHAKYRWHRTTETSEAHLLCEKREMLNEDGPLRARLSPFAFVWRDLAHPEQKPYIIRSDSAIIRFDKQLDLLDLSGANFGRIVGGALEGAVEITGPDGLRIRGQNFDFTEENLYSDFQVRFEYGPRADDPNRVVGSADKMNIRLTPANDSLLGDDLPRVGGIEEIWLRKNVVMDVEFVQDGQRKQARITSDGRLEYLVKSHEARLWDKVRIVQPTAPGMSDSLKCDFLALGFREKNPADPAAPASRQTPHQTLGGFTTELELAKLRANGSLVELRSDERDLTVKAEDILYDLDERRLVMVEQASVEVDDVKLQCPRISFHHSEEGAILDARCEGSGRIERRDPQSGRPDAEAYWTESLTLGPDPYEDPELRYLVARGDAQLLQRQQRSGIAADRIMFWLDRRLFQAADPAEEIQLPLHRVLADGDIRMDSPHAQVKRGHRLEVLFEIGDVAEPGTGASANSFLAPSPGGDGEHADNSQSPRGPALVWADQIDVHVVQDRHQADRVEVSQIIASGGCQIRHTRPDDPEGRELISATGDQITVTNGAQQSVTLRGAPGHLYYGAFHLEGNDVRFHRTANHASVEGPGLLEMPTETGLTGRKLSQPQLTSIRWVEGMAFDGQNIQFRQDIVVAQDEVQISTDALSVELNRRIDFNVDKPETQGLDWEVLRCDGRVTLKTRQWEQTKLVNMREAVMLGFEIRQSTGVFQAHGPGWIKDWNRGRRRVSFTADRTAPPKEPAHSKAGWEYVRADFDGRIVGNYHQKWANLEDNVRVIYGPVASAMETIDRDDLSNGHPSAGSSAWLGCRVLEVTLRDGGRDFPDGFVQLRAHGDAELEGEMLHARSDEISYDQSKDMFILKGEGAGKAYIWYQERPGAPDSHAAAQVIKMVPSKRQFTADSATGFWGVR